MIKIESTESSKLYFKGTTVEIAQVYARIMFTANFDGKSIDINFLAYENELGFANNEQPLNIEGVAGFRQMALTFDLALGTNPETYAAQINQVAHDKLKEFLDGLGYTNTIIGL